MTQKRGLIPSSIFDVHPTFYYFYPLAAQELQRFLVVVVIAVVLVTLRQIFFSANAKVIYGCVLLFFSLFFPLEIQWIWKSIF